MHARLVRTCARQRSLTLLCIVCLVCITPSIACTRTTLDSGPEGATTEQQLVVNGVQRTYRLHIPRHFDTNRRRVPLVIVLHGHGERAENFERATGMSNKADREGFIAVYPQALGDPSVWHTAIDGSADYADIDFIKTIIHTLAKHHYIDKQRIYAAGHSNGGFMAYRLASLLSDKIAAVGITAGSIGMITLKGDTIHFATPRHPVSVIHFHGMRDPSVPYNGGPESDGPDNVLSVDQTIRFWTRVNQCTAPATRRVSTNKNVMVDTYTPCSHGTAVVLYTIVDGTHRWPGDDIPWWKFAGPDVTDVDATDEMWEFFVTHPRTD